MAIKDIEKGMEDFLRIVDNSIMTVDNRVGAEFVRDAKISVGESVYGRTVYDKKGNVRDRKPWELSGNLQNSIGYVVVKSNAVVKSAFGGGRGGAEGKKVANEMASNVSDGLIAVAGMDYAAYVEAKGYDVISNSVEKARVTHQRMMKHVLSKITQ